jgi:hypothetical protein
MQMICRTFQSADSKRIAFLLSFLLFSAVILAPVRSASAQADHTTTNFVEPFDIVVSAADGCSGEDVHVFGIILGTMQTTIDPNGGQHVSIQFQPFLIGEGETTGQVYLPKGPAHVTSLVAPSGTTVFAATNVTRLIGVGSTANLILTEHIHLTINPDGTVTVDRDDATFACRG